MEAADGSTLIATTSSLSKAAEIPKPLKPHRLKRAHSSNKHNHHQAVASGANAVPLGRRTSYKTSHASSTSATIIGQSPVVSSSNIVKMEDDTIAC